MAAMAPPATEGVYGQRTYSGLIVSAMVDVRSDKCLVRQALPQRQSTVLIAYGVRRVGR